MSRRRKKVFTTRPDPPRHRPGARLVERDRCFVIDVRVGSGRRHGAASWRTVREIPFDMSCRAAQSTASYGTHLHRRTNAPRVRPVERRRARVPVRPVSRCRERAGPTECCRYRQGRRAQVGAAPLADLAHAARQRPWVEPGCAACRRSSASGSAGPSRRRPRVQVPPVAQHPWFAVGPRVDVAEWRRRRSTKPEGAGSTRAVDAVCSRNLAVAQWTRAPPSEGGVRTFESCRRGSAGTGGRRPTEKRTGNENEEGVTCPPTSTTSSSPGRATSTPDDSPGREDRSAADRRGPRRPHARRARRHRRHGRLGDPDQERGDPVGGRRRHRLRHGRRRARRHRGAAARRARAAARPDRDRRSRPVSARVTTTSPATPTGGWRRTSRPPSSQPTGRRRRPSSSARSARATTSSSCASTSAVGCGWCCTRAAAASATSSPRLHIAKARQLAKDLELRLEDPDLAYFVEGTPEFEAYIADMLWAQEYARANRDQMMDNAIREVFAFIGFGRETQRINCHHNFTRARGPRRRRAVDHPQGRDQGGRRRPRRDPRLDGHAQLHRAGQGQRGELDVVLARRRPPPQPDQGEEAVHHRRPRRADAGQGVARRSGPTRWSTRSRPRTRTSTRSWPTSPTSSRSCTRCTRSSTTRAPERSTRGTPRPEHRAGRPGVGAPSAHRHGHGPACTYVTNDSTASVTAWKRSEWKKSKLCWVRGSSA